MWFNHLFNATIFVPVQYSALILLSLHKSYLSYNIGHIYVEAQLFVIRPPYMIENAMTTDHKYFLLPIFQNVSD